MRHFVTQFGAALPTVEHILNMAPHRIIVSPDPFHCIKGAKPSIKSLLPAPSSLPKIANHTTPPTMAVQTLEQQKQRYSRQLAAYTFRQWNAVKDAKLPEKKDQTGPMEPPHMKSNGTNLKDASSTCSNTRRDHDNKGSWMFIPSACSRLLTFFYFSRHPCGGLCQA